MSTQAIPAQQLSTDDAACAAPRHRRSQMIGYALVALGLVLFLNNLGALRFIEWRYVWPIALIALGLVILAYRTRR